MTDLLIEDPGPKEEELDDKQESSLIEVSRRSSASVESVTYQLDGTYHINKRSCHPYQCEVICIKMKSSLSIGGYSYY